MRITGWSVDAFGHLRDSELNGLGPGVNVVVGPNESGKTTLLHYLRWVLFGFPSPNRNDFRRYKPESGRFGGRIGLVHAGRPVVLERHASDKFPTLTNDDGSRVIGHAWGDIVGTAKRELFESVFAITVDELRGFDTLDTHDVREHVYAASVVGAGRSARDVLAQLEGRRKALLSPRTGEIRALQKDLKQGLDQLAEAQREARDVPARHREVDDLDAKVQRRNTEREEVAADERLYNKLIELWPTWSAARDARRDLAALPAPVALPPDPLGRLDSATSECWRVTEEFEQAERAVRSTEGSIDEIEVDDTLHAVAAEVRTLHLRVSAAQEERSQLGQLEIEVQQKQGLVELRLRDLGPDWDRDRVERVDTSMIALGEIRDAGEHLREATDEEQAAELELGTASDAVVERERDMSELQDEIERLDRRLEGVADKPAAREAAQTLRRLLAQLNAQRQASADNARLDQRLKQLSDRATAPSLPGWVVPLIFVAAVAAGAGAVVGFTTDSVALGVLLVAVAVALAVVAVVVARARSASPEAAPPEDATGEPPGTARDVEALAERVESAAATAGLGAEPTPEAADELLENLDHARKLGDENERLARRTEQAREVRNGAATRRDEKVQTLASMQSGWESWLVDHELPADLRPEQASAFVDRVRGARDTVQALLDIEQQVVQLEESVTAFEGHVRDVLARAGVEGADDPIHALVRLAGEIDRDDEARKKRSGLENRLPEHQEAERRARGGVREANEKLEALLATAGENASEDTFREAVADEERRDELDRLVQEAEVEVRGAFGEGEAADRARGLLEDADVTRWEIEHGRLTERKQEAIEAHESAVQARQDADNELKKLEESANVARLSLRVESMRSKLEDNIERWAVDSVAHRAIGDTLRRFERERQPAVVNRAAASFGRITGERYVGLVPDRDSLEVLLQSDAKLDADLLSRGATEQLYLAMRFGLALEYAARTSLPLVLDDVLVNADHERKPRLAEELVGVGDEIQVLLFTSDPATAELLRDVAPDTTVRQLTL